MRCRRWSLVDFKYRLLAQASQSMLWLLHVEILWRVFEIMDSWRWFTVNYWNSWLEPFKIRQIRLPTVCLQTIQLPHLFSMGIPNLLFSSGKVIQIFVFIVIVCKATSWCTNTLIYKYICMCGHIIWLIFLQHKKLSGHIIFFFSFPDHNYWA